MNGEKCKDGDFNRTEQVPKSADTAGRRISSTHRRSSSKSTSPNIVRRNLEESLWKRPMTIVQTIREFSKTDFLFVLQTRFLALFMPFRGMLSSAFSANSARDPCPTIPHTNKLADCAPQTSDQKHVRPSISSRTQ